MENSLITKAVDDLEKISSKKGAEDFFKKDKELFVNFSRIILSLKKMNNYAIDFTKIKSMENIILKIDPNLKMKDSELLKSEVDIVDETNFIFTYLQNVHSLDKKKALSKSHDFNLEDKKPINQKTYEQVNKSDNSNNTSNLNQGNGTFNQTYGNMMGNIPAYIPTADPKFYSFDTKPKIIPILKKFLAILFLLTAVVSVVNYIVFPVLFTNVSGTQGSVFSSVILIVIFGYGAFAFLRKPRNEVEKYQFKQSVFVMILTMLLLYSFISRFFPVSYNSGEESKNWPNLYVYYFDSSMTAFVMFLVENILEFAIISLSILGMFLSPSIDKQKIIDAFKNPNKYMNSEKEKSRAWGKIRERKHSSTSEKN